MSLPSPFESPTLRDDLPRYPPLLQLLRVSLTTVAGPYGFGSSALFQTPKLYTAAVQQLTTDTLMPRDREPCIVNDVNGLVTLAGYYLGRLAGSYTGLPVYEIQPFSDGSRWVSPTGINTPEVQTITSSATGGYFTIVGDSTHLVYNAIANDVSTIASAVAGVHIAVTGPDGGPWVLAWPDPSGPQPLFVIDGTHLTGGSISISETHVGTCGRYPGQTGKEDESACQGVINGDSNTIWIREVNDLVLEVGKWYRAWLARGTPDGIVVYDTDEGDCPFTFVSDVTGFVTCPDGSTLPLTLSVTKATRTCP